MTKKLFKLRGGKGNTCVDVNFIYNNEKDTIVTLTHFGDDGYEYSSGSVKLKCIESLDEETLNRWLKLNTIDIEYVKETIIITFTIKYIGSNVITLKRTSYGELLDSYEQLKLLYTKLLIKYESLYEDIDSVIVGCLTDVGQGDFICRGHSVQEELDDICETYRLEWDCDFKTVKLASVCMPVKPTEGAPFGAYIPVGGDPIKFNLDKWKEKLENN